MMIAKEMYIADFRDYPYDELIKVRRGLLHDIAEFEHEFTDGLSGDGVLTSPSPEVMYQMYNEYLIELTKLINKRFNALVNDDGRGKD